VVVFGRSFIVGANHRDLGLKRAYGRPFSNSSSLAHLATRQRQVAWANDEIASEANFDIDRENIRPGEGILPFEVTRPKI
jgi:hypothetical protein